MKYLPYLLLATLLGCDNSSVTKTVTCFSAGNLVYTGSTDDDIYSYKTGHIKFLDSTGNEVYTNTECLITHKE